MQSNIGGHKFITTTDQPRYLIPYDNPICDKYGKKVTFDLHTDTHDGLSQITIPMEFEPPIAEYFQYKISEGQLYKQENRKWMKQLI